MKKSDKGKDWILIITMALIVIGLFIMLVNLKVTDCLVEKQDKLMLINSKFTLAQIYLFVEEPEKAREELENIVKEIDEYDQLKCKIRYNLDWFMRS